MMEDFITIKEAAQLLKNKVGRTTLYRMMDEGTLPKYKLGGRVFVNKSDVAGLIRKVN